MCLIYLNVLLFYYDKFKNYDYSAVKNLFIWAMSMRIGLKSLSMASINKNAIDENNIAMFYEINKARTHYEIARLTSSLDSKEATGSNKIKARWYIGILYLVLSKSV